MTKIYLSLKQIRVHQWIKNLIVFMPIFFAGEILNFENIIYVSIIFLLISCLASIVYIINDIKDIKEDQAHPIKSQRPLASGKLNINEVVLIGFVLMSILFIGLIIIAESKLLIPLIIYFILNLFYTFKLKKLVIWDIIALALMYVIRLYAGAMDVQVSGWLFATVFFGSLFLITGKRVSESLHSSNRSIMKNYPADFLNNIMYLTATATITSFSIYAIGHGEIYYPLIILFCIIIFRYIYLVVTKDKEMESPVDYIIFDVQSIVLIGIKLIYLFVVFNIIV
jgi:decaprenyl-phosphate phosphoribosyltransferase